MLITPKDLAEAIGVEPETLRKHIYRKKLVKSGKKYIDTDVPLNHEYIMAKTNGKGIDTSKIEKKVNKVQKDFMNDGPNIETQAVEVEQPKTNGFDSLELRKKRADAEKAERDNELKKLEIEKKMGKLLPVELVEKILCVNIQTIFREFEGCAENTASVYCEILGGDGTSLTKMTAEMRKMLGESIKKAGDTALKEIKIAINDYAEVRSRGERK